MLQCMRCMPHHGVGRRVGGAVVEVVRRCDAYMLPSLRGEVAPEEMEGHMSMPSMWYSNVGFQWPEPPTHQSK